MLKVFPVLILMGLLLLLLNCRSELEGEKSPRSVPEKRILQTKIDNVKIYLENSSSMGGYFRHNTEFNRYLDDILVDVSSNFDSVFALTISENVELYPSIRKFRNELNPTNPRKIAIGKSSPLDSIFYHISQSWKPDEICILFTDGIVSGTNEQIERYKAGDYNIDHLNMIKNNIKLTFGDLKNKFGVLVFGFHSHFYATTETPYFKLNNDVVTDAVFSERPYYMFVFGEPKRLRAFEQKCPDCISDFRLEFGVNDSIQRKVTYAGVRKGIIVDNDGLVFDSDERRREIPILADLSLIPAFFKRKQYLIDNAFVTVNGKKYESAGFRVDNLLLQEYDRINKPELERTIQELNGYTHLITITLQDYIYLPNDEVIFWIEKKSDKWYEDWSSLSDLTIVSGDSTTFGFSTLIKGIEEAYHDSNLIKHQFKIK